MSRARPHLCLATLVAVSIASCGGQATTLQNTAQTASAAPRPAPQFAQAPDAAPENCDKPSLSEKEACYARQSPDLIAECELVRLHSCAPYAKVHKLEEQLKQLNADFLQAARTMFASYKANDPAYLKDLEQSFVDTDRAWRAYRDAYCTLEPFSQGMSRGESGNLTEACRADKTATRVEEIKGMLSIFKEETDHEQRKQ